MRMLSLQFAARELRSGVRGFRIFLACLAVGVAAIAAAGSTAQAFRAGLATQSREILGGDLSATVQQRGFSAKEIAAMTAAGEVSFTVAVRAMAEAEGGGDRRLVELRGVSSAYPLYGTVGLSGETSLSGALAPRGKAWGAAVEQSLIDRLGLKLGDRLLVGNSPIEVTAVLLEEPDRLSRGFALGPRVLVQRAALDAGGFLEPGLPSIQTARIALRPDEDLQASKRRLRNQLGSDVRLRDRNNAAPGASRLLDQLEYFLGFIGLAALLAGGLGVAGAVTAFLESRKPSIATLKVLGASGALVRNTYLLQISVLAVIGVGMGVAAGAVAPFVVAAVLPADLPIPALFAIYPEPLLRSASFGLLVAAAFSLIPIARARATTPASLFRKDLRGRLGLSVETIGAAMAAAGLAALAVITAPTKLLAAGMLMGATVAFFLLWLLGLAAAWASGRLRRLARGPLRIGLANLAGPQSSAKTVAPAIGLGVALLAMVLLIQSSLLRQVTEVAPQTAPSLVFTDVPAGQGEAFDLAVAAAVGRHLTSEEWARFPMVSGRIVALNGVAVEKAAISQGERWAFDRDISMSAIGPEPASAGVVEGRWWAAGETQPQVAMEVDAARGAGLKVGQSITLSILGRDITAKVAALRKVEFGGFGPNFAVVLNPAALSGAPLRYVALAKLTAQEDGRVTHALGATFPEVDVISVREQLEAATGVFDRLALALRAAAGVALLAGLLVLAGALATGATTRMREAAILKVLGASRGQILAAYGLEYGSVGLIAGMVGVVMGSAAAWPVIRFIFKSAWDFDWAAIAVLLAGVAAVTAGGGLLATWQALKRRPARALRTA